MRGSLYRERDYVFGQTILTVRTRIGLTQAGLAESLGVSRKAIGGWERGSSYPQADHLKQFIALAIQHQAFPLGRVAEEVRAIWLSARQKVFMDETWLAALLPGSEISLFLPPGKETSADGLGPQVDWNDALAVPSFYGRMGELDLLASWVAAERCRVVSVSGLGGIGKSVLAARLMRRIATAFDVVIWRSLRDLPTFDNLLDECLQVLAPKALAPQSLRGEPPNLERRPGVLLEQMRKSRVLLVLDEFEAVLKKGEAGGKMHSSFAGFERFLSLAAETDHKSCVLLTSREIPAVLVPLEGGQAPVRVLRLARLDYTSCEKLLAEKEVVGSWADRARLIETYAGNPLALKIVAQTIVDLYKGEIAPFLEQGEVVFGGVRDLLEGQFARLSRLEQDVLLWLAILREPATLDDLSQVLASPVPRSRLLEVLETLYRQSMIERGQKNGSFTLQPVVIEYLTA